MDSLWKVPRSCKPADASEAFGTSLKRVCTIAWKAKTAFHTYTQGPAAMIQKKEEEIDPD
jgi:hypothetical protein